jgi:hypothetical protein
MIVRTANGRLTDAERKLSAAREDSPPLAPTHVDMGVATDQSLSVPTAVRKSVVRLGVSLAFLAFLDRTCISQAAPKIMRDLHLTTLQMGYAFSAFGLTYAALEIPHAGYATG